MEGLEEADLQLDAPSRGAKMLSSSCALAK